MTGPEHFRRAEDLLASISQGHPAGEVIAMAQVHATLANAAAVALAADGQENRSWHEAAGSKPGPQFPAARLDSPGAAGRRGRKHPSGRPHAA